MGIFETFSKRQAKRERAGLPDVYQYDNLPEALRTQIYLILQDALGRDYERNVGHNRYSSRLWQELHDQMCRELGVFNLDDNAQLEAQEKCRRFLLSAPTSEAIDFIEMAFWMVAKLPDLPDHATNPSVQMEPEDAIEELNHRLREHGVGYPVRGRRDSAGGFPVPPRGGGKTGHIAPQYRRFRGRASNEFLKAHEHYRKSRMGEAMSGGAQGFREHHEGDLR
jgi:hypothetical protein